MTPQLAPVPTLAYLRVSKEEQARQDKTSLMHQRTRIATLAERLGVVVVRTFEDPGASGGTDNRPAFRQLLAYCQAHPQPVSRPGYILVYNDSRWGRWPNPERAAFWRVTYEELGWMVRYAESDEVEDLTTRTIMRAAAGASATAFRETIRQNARQGGRGTAAQGFWNSEAPIGYRRLAMVGGQSRVLAVGQQKAKDERVKLTLGPVEEVALIHWLFETYAAGSHSLGTLGRMAADRWPEKRWSKQTLRQVLTNRTYLGEIRYGQTQGNARHITTPRETWVIVPDAHPVLINPDLFERVQSRLAFNSKTVRKNSSPYILSGLISCAHCEHHFIGGGGPRGPENDPDRYRFYRDSGSETMGGPGCPGIIATMTKRIVEPMVIDTIAQLVQSDVVQAEIDRAIAERVAQVERTLESGPSETDRKRLEAQRDRLVQAISAGTLTELEARGQVVKIREALGELSAAGERARFAARSRQSIAEWGQSLRQLAANFSEVAAKAHGLQLRELLRPWIHSMVFDKVARTLTLTLRPVPGLAFLCASSVGQERDSP